MKANKHDRPLLCIRTVQCLWRHRSTADQLRRGADDVIDGGTLRWSRDGRGRGQWRRHRRQGPVATAWFYRWRDVIAWTRFEEHQSFCVFDGRRFPDDLLISLVMFIQQVVLHTGKFMSRLMKDIWCMGQSGARSGALRAGVKPRLRKGSGSLLQEVKQGSK